MKLASMSTHETLPEFPEVWTDEDPTERKATVPPAGLVERTAKELCKRCGGRAATRCAGCGEAFCAACVDPISASAPEVRCRECAPRIGQGPPQGSPLLLEQILGQVLARLSATAPNPLVNAMRNEALECQALIDAWRAAPPSTEDRGRMRERVLALHAKVKHAP
jgi:hypothetical protein